MLLNNRRCLFIGCLLLAILFLVGCDYSLGTTREPTPANKTDVGAAIPESKTELEDELRNTRARLRLLEGALDDVRTESIQTNLWLGSGACFFAALALIAIGIWTTRRTLIELGIAAAGIGGLLIFAAWLAPYALWIGIAFAVIVIGVCLFMLFNREKTLQQLTYAVDEVKPLLPKYKNIFREHIDKAQDNLINHVRKTRA